MELTIFHMLLISLGINTIFFILASIFKTDAFTDITYASTVALLIIIQFILTPSISFYSIFLLVAVILWAIRLGSYLFVRIQKIKVDHRFDKMRNNPLRFGIFWFLQSITVWIILLPIFGLLRYESILGSSTISAIQATSMGLFVIGFIIEIIADAQKYKFKNANPDAFMQTGLWKYSRHPNFFGELMVWWGLAIPGFAVFSGLEFLYFLGPVFLSVIILFGTGIPPLERSWKKKWGDNPEFQEYRRKTSLFFPAPPKR
jgi:steroid 5-alpha reductase family enzyme